MSQKVDTLVGIDEILREGFPDKDYVVESLPFGEHIIQACKKGLEGAKGRPPQDEKKTDEQRQETDGERNHAHFQKIIGQMNGLLDEDLADMIEDRSTPLGKKVLNGWLSAWIDVYGPAIQLEDEDKQMWRLESFLHDVGKSLDNSKHPTRGHWLISHLDPEENHRVRKICGEQKFRQLQRVVAYHERFGVATTGEGSYAVLADMLDRGTTAANVGLAKRDIFHVLVLNIIDATTYFGKALPSERLEVYLRDWNVCCSSPDSPLQQSRGDRAVFERQLIEMASRTEYTIDRASRLLQESYRSFYDRISRKHTYKSPLPLVAEVDFRQLAGDALQPELGCRFDDFRVNFAYITKLDYFLSLTMKVVHYYMLNERKLDDLAVCFVSMIRKLHDQFSDLILHKDSRSRIGVDFSVLRRTPEVQDRIANLLSGPLSGLSYGLEWLAEEATAWPFQ